MDGEKGESVQKQNTEEWEIYKNQQSNAEQEPTTWTSWFPWGKTGEVRNAETERGKDAESKTSEDYWATVWKNMHKDGSRGSGPMPDCKIREKWINLQKEGKTNEEIIEILKKENPSSMVWLPFMRHMGEADGGKSCEDIGEEIFQNIKKHQLEMMTPEQRKTYEQMKADNREQEFWKNHWKEMHKAGHFKASWIKMMYGRAPWQGPGRSESSDDRQETEQSPIDGAKDSGPTHEDGKSHEEIRKQIFQNIKKHQLEMMTPEQKKTYEKMKGENKENEFWKNHWEEIHKDGQFKAPWMGRMHRCGPWHGEGHSESREEGQAPEQPQRDRHGHHGHRHMHWGAFGPFGWRRCGQKGPDEKQFYKEFDFVN